MSAFMQSTEHIDALVHAGYKANALPLATSATEMGEILLLENAKSMNHRYRLSERAPDELAEYVAQAETYRYEPTAYRRAYSPVEILKAVRGYEYQACEHPEWEASAAREFCVRLTAAMVGKLPGYDAADTWSIG